MMDQEEKIKYLEFVQNIVTRMNNNSFQIKNWCVITVSAIFTISISKENFYILLVALLPIILFWFLDAYYLTQERRFRGLYDQAIKKESSLGAFEMNTSSFRLGQYRYFKVLSSKTISSLYITMIIVVLIMFCLIQYKGGTL